MPGDGDEPLDVAAAAEELAAAARTHAQAIEAGSAEARQVAGRLLVDAMDAYGVAVASAGGDVPEELAEFQDWFDEVDGVERPESDATRRVSLFTRTDLFIEDPARLRAAAAARLAACCADAVDDVEAAIAEPADALSHLVGHEPTSLEEGSVEQYGLRILTWTSQAMAGLPDYLDDPWAPLRHAVADES